MKTLLLMVLLIITQALLIPLPELALSSNSLNECRAALIINKVRNFEYEIYKKHLGGSPDNAYPGLLVWDIQTLVLRCFNNGKLSATEALRVLEPTFLDSTSTNDPQSRIKAEVILKHLQQLHEEELTK